MTAAISTAGPSYEFTVTWRPFFLRPDTPLEGKEKEPLVIRPDGSNSRVMPRLAELGRQAGIDFTGRTDRVPNTLASHVALDYARAVGGLQAGDQLMELLFRAYFTDGVFLDADAVAALAGRVPGLTTEGARDAMGDRDLAERVRAEAAHFSRAGISGVPFFIMNNRPAFSGAQSLDRFAMAFQRV